MSYKWVIVCLWMMASFLTWQPSYATAEAELPKTDSRELQLQDMLVLSLLPYMQDKLAEQYANVLNTTPQLYPYFVDVKQIERVNGFRGFDFLITLDAMPTVGPHIAVGEDRFTFRVSPIVNVRLERFEHIKGPDKSDFPPNYQDMLK